MILNTFLGGQHVFTLLSLRFALGSICLDSLVLNCWSYTAAYKSKNFCIFGFIITYYYYCYYYFKHVGSIKFKRGIQFGKKQKH